MNEIFRSEMPLGANNSVSVLSDLSLSSESIRERVERAKERKHCGGRAVAPTGWNRPIVDMFISNINIGIRIVVTWALILHTIDEKFEIWALLVYTLKTIQKYLTNQI